MARSRLQADRATHRAIPKQLHPDPRRPERVFLREGSPNTVAPCRFGEILRAKRRAQDDGERGIAKMCRRVRGSLKAQAVGLGGSWLGAISEFVSTGF
ncbi:hypothetical protein Lsha_0168 [Legionella shakespearei DSM 23087]|uniref:Uncharacterized protein n=1 Tax=Legionella shakespearei DSM 23087 TaxID=1122169 RepID=A0A0W0ZA94_9GAMM|nr:hypothetical protein Lsha_0168 [Legionella shakespearei DSM 23087]